MNQYEMKNRSWDRHKKVSKICEYCLNQYHARKSSRFCSIECWHGFAVNKNHPCWKGGRSKFGKYISILLDNGKRRLEHIIIAEEALCRPLKVGEVVHHINGNGSDNRNENLLICNRSYHAWLHQRMAQKYMEENFA